MTGEASQVSSDGVAGRLAIARGGPARLPSGDKIGRDGVCGLLVQGRIENDIIVMV